MNYKSLNEHMDVFEQRFLGDIPFADDLWDEVMAFRIMMLTRALKASL